jgi:hypothetical protein
LHAAIGSTDEKGNRSLGCSGTRMMLIHDNMDGEFPIGEAFNIYWETGNIRLFVTDGYGHSGILANRNVMKEIKH